MTIVTVIYYGIVGALAGIGAGAFYEWLAEVVYHRRPKDNRREYQLPIALFTIVGMWFSALAFVGPYLVFMITSLVGLGIGLGEASEYLLLTREYYVAPSTARGGSQAGAV